MLRERAVLKRKIETELLRWKNELAPRYALFLTGAPMAGKTALAQQLAKTYRSSILIRLDEASEELKSLFTEGLADLETFFALLQLLYRTKLYRGKSLIILDAVEAFPPARQALKRLLEDGRYHYLETGTKAAVVKAGSAFLVPSEEYAIDVFWLFRHSCGRRAMTERCPFCERALKSDSRWAPSCRQCKGRFAIIFSRAACRPL